MSSSKRGRKPTAQSTADAAAAAAPVVTASETVVTSSVVTSKRGSSDTATTTVTESSVTTAAGPAATKTVTTVILDKKISHHSNGGGATTEERFGFQVRESRLEYTRMEGDMQGFFNLVILGFVTFIVSHLVVNYYESKTILEVELLWALVDQLHIIFPVVIAMLFYTWTAFFLQKLITSGLLHCDSYFTHALQHTIQSGLFVYALMLVFWLRWPTIQTAAFVMEMIVLFMKMHSYIQMNRQFALAQAATKSDKPSTDPTVYPNNCTLRNYVDYMLVPTLVYETSYPRTATVRVSYVLEKVIATSGCILAMYFTTSVYIVPVLVTVHELPFIHAVAKLMIPFTVNYMLIFYVIFECICNCFAELTRFADREFYQDWWNSVGFEEYARKWNKPVHEFLRRHIYAFAREKSHSKTIAMIVTFLFSSLLHELVLVMMFRFFRPYFFAMQMTQLPLIYFGSKLRHYPRLGNFFFWFGMTLGPAMLAISYVREFHAIEAAAGRL